MEQAKIQDPLPQLVKMLDTYSLIVPKHVEEKIRYLLRKYPNTEWSGVLFYSHTGTFEGKDLVITCEDLFPMDLGTTGWTEFKMTEDVTSYMAEHIELFECETGLIHSHHTMGAFFSGQDVHTLQVEGADTNCFVSLIVDTKGEYKAAITRKIQTQSEVTIQNKGQSYQFFGDGEVKVADDTTEKFETIESETIQYFMLDVTREEVVNPLDYLDERFAQIEHDKRFSLNSSYSYRGGSSSYKAKEIDFNNGNLSDSVFEDEEVVNTYSKTKTPDSSNTTTTKPWSSSDTMEVYDGLLNYTPNADLVHAAVVRILTCSLAVKIEGFDLANWIDSHMLNMYAGIFPKPNSIKDVSAFDSWKDFIVEHEIFNFKDPEGEDLKELDEDMYHGAIAKAIIKELQTYSSNAYIESYISAIESYLV